MRTAFFIAAKLFFRTLTHNLRKNLFLLTGGNYPIVRGPWKGGTGATPDYVSHHKQWTEEVLQEQGGRGQALSNRFFIGSYDTGISDMRTEPLQFFCTPRFYTPFHDAPHPLFDT